MLLIYGSDCLIITKLNYLLAVKERINTQQRNSSLTGKGIVPLWVKEWFPYVRRKTFLLSYGT